MKNEIYEIPYRAELCYSKNKGIILPENIPYIGMGSSYYATLVFKYLGVKIAPETGSDYFHYLTKKSIQESAVLISQSGRSSEILWCAELFSSYVAIVNDTKSPLAENKNRSRIITLYAGTENLIPTKTYMNTLITLYLGFGFDPGSVVQILKNQLFTFQEQGAQMGDIIYKKIRKKKLNGIYILGNGPNLATAHQAALVLSEVAKIPVLSMSVPQYDHGYKETAPKSLVIVINPSDSSTYKRTKTLLNKIKLAGADIFELSHAETEEKFSPLTFPVYFFFAAESLANRLKISNPFVFGEKVTKTDAEHQ
jgi:glucosamine--fructose-6-phosphate aminotransferase (isomerizing)